MKSRNESLIRLKKFQVDEHRRVVAQIDMMIADFERMAAELKTGISDATHFAYSTFAKAALTRRDNLMTSANDMRDKLESAQDQLAESLEDLKKVETLSERETQRQKAEATKAEQDEYDEIARIRHIR